MICYRDRTWCSAKCGNTECSRNVTPEVRKAGNLWWNKDENSKEGFPIAITDFQKNCKDYKEIEDEGRTDKETVV